MQENKHDEIKCFICEKLLQDEDGKTFDGIYRGILKLNSSKDDALCGKDCYKKYFEAQHIFAKMSSETFFKREYQKGFDEGKKAAYDEAYRDIATKVGREELEKIIK